MSLSTCWKAPSTLRLRRFALDSSQAASALTAMPATAVTTTIGPCTSGGSSSLRTPS